MVYHLLVLLCLAVRVVKRGYVMSFDIQSIKRQIRKAKADDKAGVGFYFYKDDEGHIYKFSVEPSEEMLINSSLKRIDDLEYVSVLEESNVKEDAAEAKILESVKAAEKADLEKEKFLKKTIDSIEDDNLKSILEKLI